MDIFVFLFSLFLVILGMGILRNWTTTEVKELNYSIIIACRNEEKNLPKLFSSLENLDYPKKKFEIIIVDDASTDNSPNLLKAFCEEKQNASFFHLKEKSKEYLGKKAALKLAVENAKFEILLFTDADCFPQKNWISSYNNYFTDKTGFIVGNYEEIDVGGFRRFCNQMSSAIYACTIGLRFPFSAAGGNMAVRKGAFEQVGGYEKIKHNIAGDDKQLLNLIKKTSWKIRYNPEVLVSTEVDHSNSHNKAKRKYGKFGMSSPLFQLFSILIFLFYLYLPYKIIIVKEWHSFLSYFLCAILFWFANIIKHKYKFSPIDLFFIVIYPYYLIYYSILGLSGNWKWKN
jgi:poly-beta-1,6-N-acetyl-D-glucosamine synthase